MPIDVDMVRGAELAEATAFWNADDVMLYHLGIGAGVPPEDRDEIRYVYESDLKVLPTFGVVPATRSLFELLSLPGVDVDLATMLHGEHDLQLESVLPTEAEVRLSARVIDVFDKGKAALVVLEVTMASADGGLLCTNRFKAFFPGEGGFGGEAGPRPANAPPQREPDCLVERATLPQQALLYRLSGDRNPLHADPAFAQRAGFSRPILHGLCSYGIVCKAVVDAVLDGDVTRVARFEARFAGVVFPGETLLVSMWDEGDRIFVEARTQERQSVAISHAALTLRED